MEKSKRKELESQIQLAIHQLLMKTDISAAIKTEKLVKTLSKTIAKKFGKAKGNVKKKLAVAKPLTYKGIPAKKKVKTVTKKKKK